MFTGLIEKTGTVVALSSSAASEYISKLTIKVANFACQDGDSVAVNGCCLTVAAQNHEGELTFDVSQETLNCTTLTSLGMGSLVNLERALTLASRLGGHLVSGHVDGTAEVLRLEKQEKGWLLEIGLAGSADPYVIHKGSLCLEGVSLTINAISPLADNRLRLSFMLIPTTVENTTFKELKVGDRLNVEFDLIGKYLEKLASPYHSTSEGQKFPSE